MPNLFAVETVDSAKKANELNKGRKQLELSEKLRVFVQVNTSGEAEKSGIEPEEAEGLAKHIMDECEQLQLYGIMTIGALATSQGQGENQDFKVMLLSLDRDDKGLNISETQGIEESIGEVAGCQAQVVNGHV